MEPAPRSLQDDLSDFNMKIMLLGDVGVGKTSLLRHESGVEDGEGAPGAIADSGGAAPNLLVKLYQVGGLTYQVTYWDAPGGGRYGDLTARYCLGAAATIIVFDVTRRATVRVSLSFLGNVLPAYQDQDAPTVLDSRARLHVRWFPGFANTWFPGPRPTCFWSRKVQPSRHGDPKSCGHIHTHGYYLKFHRKGLR